MNNKTMEEELTLKQADNLEDTFITYIGDDALERAMLEVMLTGGQLYTQIYGEDNHVYYVKGLHIINRTGVYAVRIPRRQ